jgi:hypothetical protein
MALLGRLIKGAIHLGHSFVLDQINPKEAQEKELKNLIEKAKDTAFGEYYKFHKILKSDNIRREFSNRVPIFEYNKIQQEWWHRVQNNEPNITWPGKSKYFALSSGTTGNQSKRIPVTEDMLHSIRMAGIQQVLHLDKFDLPTSFFEKDILMLGSSTSLIHQHNHWEGEISGISAGNIPFWFENYYKPGREIASLTNWEEKVKQITINAPKWDVGAIAGIPAWVQLMIENIIEYHQIDHIHEIWPNLTVYASGGVSFDPYQKNFEKILGHPIYIIDTYLASEGFLACQTRPDTKAMSLILNNGIYFEFIPFNNQNFDSNSELVENPEVLTVDQVKPDQEYALLISTCAGTWRYMIGDTIRFADIDKQEIIITGRTKHFMNVAGSQLSIEKMNAAIDHLQKIFEVSVSEFVLSAIPHQNGFAHKWYLGVEGNVNKYSLKEELDKFLKEINKNYKIAREKALKEVFVETISPDLFLQWQAEFKKLGDQSKTPRVMKEEQFLQFENFIKTCKVGSIQTKT